MSLQEFVLKMFLSFKQKRSEKTFWQIIRTPVQLHFKNRLNYVYDTNSQYMYSVLTEKL